MFTTVLSVALGGAIGAVARYLVSLGTGRLLGAGFPWGTLAVNVIGSFLMGLFVVVLAQKGGIRMAPFLMTGVLGGFTTFSAFSLDAVVLFERGNLGQAAGYVMASVGLSLGAIVLAMILARGMME